MYIRKTVLFCVFFCAALIQQTEQCSDGTVRLVNGRSNNEGRAEICVGGSWRCVCDEVWTFYEAEVFCRQLGLPTGVVLAYDSAYFGQGTGQISEIYCYGGETSVFDCDIESVDNCDHSNDAGVACLSSLEKCAGDSIRLVNGESDNEGRVEVCVNNGHWGTVCDYGWDNSDAEVVCRQLGYLSEGAVAYSEAHFGSGMGLIVLEDLSCIGSENSIFGCEFTTDHICNHFYDGGVICQPKPSRSLSSSSLTSTSSITMTSTPSTSAVLLLSSLKSTSSIQTATAINLPSVHSTTTLVVTTSTPLVVFINALIISIYGFTTLTFSDDDNLLLRAATVNSCNAYCSSNVEVCNTVSISRRENVWASLSVDAVKILSVTDTSSGIDIVTYVALSTNSILSIDSFTKAVLEGIKAGEYNDAGFPSVTAKPFSIPDVSTSISIVSIVGILFGVIIILGIGIIGITLTVLYCNKRKFLNQHQNTGEASFEANIVMTNLEQSTNG